MDNLPNSDESSNGPGTSTVPKPDWSMWRHLPRPRLREAIALSCDIAPEAIWDLKRQNSPALHEYAKRLRVASGALDAHLFDAEVTTYGPGPDDPDRWVDLYSFSAWIVTIGWKLPAEFPRPGAPASSPEREPRTKLLAFLAEAERKFWLPFDRGEVATPPTNKEIAQWLQYRGVTKRVAQIMAQILRADEVNPGLQTERKRNLDVGKNR